MHGAGHRPGSLSRARCTHGIVSSGNLWSTVAQLLTYMPQPHRISGLLHSGVPRPLASERSDGQQ
eukprot:scaffold10895_cov129-Isochrysis_galbana.AAC.3